MNFWCPPPTCGEWTRVDAKMPEVGQRVIATDGMEVDLAVCSGPLKRWVSVLLDEAKVVAWMPLPDGYREKW